MPASNIPGRGREGLESPSRLSAARQAHGNACGRADEQQETRRRLDEEAGQPLLHGPTVAGEIHSTAYYPNDTEHCREDVAQVGCTKPQWRPNGESRLRELKPKGLSSLLCRTTVRWGGSQISPFRTGGRACAIGYRRLWVLLWREGHAASN